MKYEGTWRITEMELWDQDYLDMEVEAFITIDDRGNGQFQFGLVSGHIDGDILKDGKNEKLEFTWEGNDECDPAQGSGWLKLKSKNIMNGEIKFHKGDRSGLIAKRI